MMGEDRVLRAVYGQLAAKHLQALEELTAQNLPGGDHQQLYDAYNAAKDGRMFRERPGAAPVDAESWVLSNPVTLAEIDAAMSGGGGSV